ncbi:hypothetical protein GF420_12010 [candidate division GN15 bacterium]|nr:hypothetical protein [candidate division GN15 bacterium]
MQPLKYCIYILAVFVLAIGGLSVYADTATPGGTEDLTTIDLIINPNQVVGHPLRGDARIRLFDENDDPVADYSLVDSPLVLVPSAGELTPDTVDDQSLFSNGLINLLPLGVTYRGPSAVVDITALADTLASNATVVSFNGYDILGAFFTDGSSISQIFAGVPTSITVPVQNNGSLLPAEDPWIRTYFTSGGGSVKVFFDGQNNGRVDTVSVLLPEVTGAPREDTLLVELMSGFSLGDSVYSTADTLLIPVSILPTPSLTIIPGTVSPDSIYTGLDFTLGFDVRAESVVTDIDSTPVTIRLVRDPAGTVVSTLFSGTPSYTQPQPDILQYRNIAIPGGTVLIDSGWYRVEFDYAVYSGAPPTIIKNVVADSMLLKQPPALSSLDTTLTPTSLVSGATVSFEFEVSLDGDEPVELVGSRTTFSVVDSTFSTTVSLRAENGTLNPGINLLTADPIQIPAELAPDTLTAEAVVSYREIGLGNSARLETSFAGQQIEILTPIAIQLVETEITGVPNAPFVNTNQQFEVTARVANLADREATDVEVVIATNGQSQPSQDTVMVGSIPAYDTIDVMIPVTASVVSNLAETFTVEVLSTGAEVLEPVDNEALVTVQTPASLVLTCEFAGLDADYVGVGERFALVASLSNEGQGEVVTSDYSMSTFGLNLGVADPTLGEIDADSSISFILTAPDFDTLATVAFELLETPMALNTGDPAQINFTACTLRVQVSSMQSDLVVESEAQPGNLVARGRDAEIFTLYLTNRGLSARSPIEIEQIGMSFVDRSGQPVSVRSIVETSATGFAEGGQIVTTATAGTERLIMTFDNYVIDEGEQRFLTFRARIKSGAPDDFRIEFTADDIVSTYLAGPFAGESTGAMTPGSPDGSIFSQNITAVSAGAQSLTIRDNPFNPDYEPAVFSYELAEATPIQFRILTLTGEEVYSIERSLGEAGTDAGSHVLEWDGRNGEGHTVLNGVYIALLRTVINGDQKLLKVAVVK